jgi:hypothetical protein
MTAQVRLTARSPERKTTSVHSRLVPGIRVRLRTVCGLTATGEPVGSQQPMRSAQTGGSTDEGERQTVRREAAMSRRISASGFGSGV